MYVYLFLPLILYRDEPSLSNSFYALFYLAPIMFSTLSISLLYRYDTEKREQSFIHGSDGSLGMDAIAVSTNKKSVAIAEHRRDESTGQNKPFVSLFDVQSFRKRRQFSCSEVTSQKYTCISFSNDGKYILALSGPDDQKLVCWTCDKAKVRVFLTSLSFPSHSFTCSYLISLPACAFSPFVTPLSHSFPRLYHFNSFHITCLLECRPHSQQTN